jgi:hypothetical protein
MKVFVVSLPCWQGTYQLAKFDNLTLFLISLSHALHFIVVK